MKKSVIIPLLSVAFLVGCSSNKQSKTNKLGGEEVVLPDVFKNTNYCNIAITYYSGGVALILNENNQPDIQNISFEQDFYSIEFQQLPLKKSGNTYFLPFKVTNQIIDDGYLKNGTEYKFWLSYTNETYTCGFSLNDDTLTEPTAELMPNVM